MVWIQLVNLYGNPSTRNTLEIKMRPTTSHQTQQDKDFPSTRYVKYHLITVSFNKCIFLSNNSNLRFLCIYFIFIVWLYMCIFLCPVARRSYSEKNGQRCRSIKGSQGRTVWSETAVAPHADGNWVSPRCGKHRKTQLEISWQKETLFAVYVTVTSAIRQKYNTQKEAQLCVDFQLVTQSMDQPATTQLVPPVRSIACLDSGSAIQNTRVFMISHPPNVYLRDAPSSSSPSFCLPNSHQV